MCKCVCTSSFVSCGFSYFILFFLFYLILLSSLLLDAGLFCNEREQKGAWIWMGGEGGGGAEDAEGVRKGKIIIRIYL